MNHLSPPPLASAGSGQPPKGSHAKSFSTDTRYTTVKNRLLRNFMGTGGPQEYKVLERSLSRYHQKDRYKVDVIKNNLLPWLKQQQPNLDVLYTDRCHYFECILALMSRKEFDEFDRLEDLISKPTTPSTLGTLVDSPSQSSTSATEQTSSTTSVSSSTTLGSGYPFTDSGAFWAAFHQYRRMLHQSLQYAVERLNQKGVYSNVITFCAKILAQCFFKLPGVAFGLLHALPVSRSYIGRMAKTMEINTDHSGIQHVVSLFPEHLSMICFSSPRTWWRDYDRQKRKIASGEIVPPMEMYGNWVRRWQSDDSELFFAFYRHYHRCLSQYLLPLVQKIQAGGWAKTAISPKVYASAPGYLYLSAFFLTKIEGLVHREIHPVTTIVQFEPSAANGNGAASDRDRVMASVATGEYPGTTAPPPAIGLANNGGAGGQGGQDGAGGGETGTRGSKENQGKPKVLDTASRRFVETIVVIMEDQGDIYGAMLDIWIRVVVTKTSVYDVESVFCLLDFIDMLITELEGREGLRLYDRDLSWTTASLTVAQGAHLVPINVNFLLSTIHVLLIGSDHTVTLMRTLSFVYQNFALLTSTVASLERLVLGTILSTQVFEKCFLHWARNVRLYYMRCLVWRVARLQGGVGILPGWGTWAGPGVRPLLAPNSEESSPPPSSMSSPPLSPAQPPSPPASPQPQQTSQPDRKKDKAQNQGQPQSNAGSERTLSPVTKKVLEMMESRIEMIKRQYMGELTESLSSGDRDEATTATTPPTELSSPPSPSMDYDLLMAPIEEFGATSAPSSPSSALPQLAAFSAQQLPTESTLAKEDEFYLGLNKLLPKVPLELDLHAPVAAQLQAKEEAPISGKKSTSRASLLGRKFRRLSRSESTSSASSSDQSSGSLSSPNSSSIGMGHLRSRSQSMDGASDLSLRLEGIQGVTSSKPEGGRLIKRPMSMSSGSSSGAGRLLRWIFVGGSSSNSSKVSLASTASEDAAGTTTTVGGMVSSLRGSMSATSLPSTIGNTSSMSSSSISLTLPDGSINGQGGDDQSGVGAIALSNAPFSLSLPSTFQQNSDRTSSSSAYPSFVEDQKTRRYPQQLTTYAGRSISEYSAVLNEYVDWLAQCHAFGVKSRLGPNHQLHHHHHLQQQQAALYASQGVFNSMSAAAATGAITGGSAASAVTDFGLFCTGLCGFAQYQMRMQAGEATSDDWISPGMAHMMVLRFPGLVVEWPKFWNSNSRDNGGGGSSAYGSGHGGGPPPLPITELSGLDVVNNPAFSMGKPAGGGIGGTISAGAGGLFGGHNLHVGGGIHGPGSLRHQQQAQLHQQQQMQLLSRQAAAATAAVAAVAQAQAQAQTSGASAVESAESGTSDGDANTSSLRTPQRPATSKRPRLENTIPAMPTLCSYTDSWGDLDADDDESSPKRSRRQSPVDVDFGSIRLTSQSAPASPAPCSRPRQRRQLSSSSATTPEAELEAGGDSRTAKLARPTSTVSASTEKAASRERTPRPKPYICKHPGCNMAYAKPCKLEEHTRIHTGERPFKCTVSGCTSAFRRSTNLAVHLKSHSNQRDAVCPVVGCDKAFYSNHKLKRHLQSHESIELSAEITCSLSAEQIQETIQHNLESKPLECHWEGCGRRFAKRQQLNSHVSVDHRGTRPYVCEHEGCHRDFLTPSKLRKHRLTHNEDRRYECGYPDCSQVFTKWSVLQKHITEVHKKNPNLRKHVKAAHEKSRAFKCVFEGCGKIFQWKHVLKKHTDAIHLSPLKKRKKRSDAIVMTELEKFIGPTEERYRELRPIACAVSTCRQRFTTWSLMERHLLSQAHEEDMLWTEVPQEILLQELESLHVADAEQEQGEAEN
ncbi:hypothetical protein DFQ27_005305 [Actinomortierella ambigua]|uniref:C2H2-type domain-containing protein n=1 Tax=Actinomortierella ambigua TaxID=1343610 RepID=A0A9P6PZB7_9FUNG|nr:hypothetical protein DFQ27_005305 [Actinomortierella ambigua]